VNQRRRYGPTDQLSIADRSALERERIRFVLALGRALHRYGTPAHRLEEALGVVCKQLSLTAEVLSTPTFLMVRFGDPAELRTSMLRAESSELDLAKLDPEAGLARIAAIEQAPRVWGKPIETCTFALTPASVTVFFGGSGRDVIAAAAVGLLIGLLALIARPRTHAQRAFELGGAFIAAFGAGFISSQWSGITPSIVTVGAMIALLPGLALTTAMTELATRNLVSGTARLMGAVIVLLELALGVALGERMAGALFDVVHTPHVVLPAWTTWIAMLASSLGLVVVCQAEVRAIPWILLACIVGFVGARQGTELLGPQLGVLLGAFLLGILANLYARALDRPQQVVLVPAMILLVPGSLGFRGMSSMLDRDTLTGIETTFATFVVAMAIVAGLLIANAVLSPRRVL
jgi:uncharacterized membrane protein YjjB (DUF3815 family)